MEWALVVFFFAGTMAKGDEVSATTVHGFQSAAVCEVARTQVLALPRGYKDATAVCVRVK